MAPQEGPQQTGEDHFDSQDFLTDLGIESFADREIRDHEGNLMPLSEALVVCPPARDQLRSTVELITTLGGDVQAGMDTYFSSMRDQTPERPGAQTAPAEHGEAEKK